MSAQFIGEIRMFGGTFAPVGWVFCDGRLLPIAQYTPLFALIGTTYGGNGTSTFGVPDLRGRIPIHAGAGFVIGGKSGSETVTLTAAQMPLHTHTARASGSDGTLPGPSGNYWAASSLGQFSPGTPTTAMAAACIGAAGSNQAHENRMPFLAINFIIATEGIFPSRS